MSAALPRTLNQDVLAAIDDTATAELFGWLTGQPFIAKQAGCWKYHDVVRSAMLRLQRAQSPSRWRIHHDALARAHRQWADQAASDETGMTWSSPDWVEHTREAAYYQLCADPAGHLTGVLATAVRTADNGAAQALRWAELIADACRDAGDQTLQSWGSRLLAGITSGELAGYLSALIDDGGLPQVHLLLALRARGEEHRLAQRHLQAVADYSRIIDLEPGDSTTSWAFAERGRANRRIERFDDAVADLTRAITLDPGYAWAVAERGRTYRFMERFDDAVADLSKAIEINPRYAWAVAERGRTYRMMECFDDALADLSRAIEVNPDYAWAIAERGQTYCLMGHYDDALADLNRAIILDPGYAWAIAERGRTYRLMRRYDDALADLSRAIDLSPARAQNWKQRAEILIAIGRHAEAQADSEQARALDTRIAGPPSPLPSEPSAAGLDQTSAR